jgi:CRISPR-associated endonuclease Csn1
VSHKPDHGTGGKLHEETAYGLIRDPAKEDGATLVYRKALTALNENEIGRIRDRALRDRVQRATVHANGSRPELAKALAAFSAETGIRHVRLTKVEEGFVTLADKDDRPYKALIPGDNYCVEIYALPDGEWKTEPVSVYAANQPRNNDRSETLLVMRLHKGDFLKLDYRGNETVMRVVQLEPSANRVRLVTHNESGNLQKRHEDPDDPFRWDLATISKLKSRKARKVTVDFLGRVHDPGPPK